METCGKVILKELIRKKINKILTENTFDYSDKILLELFGDGLEGYTAGYIMANSIDEVLGREVLIKSMLDIFSFVENYNKSIIKLGNELVPIVV